MTNNEQRISVGELFTSSFFSIPALLLYNHGYIINSILAWSVFVSSLIYHRHITETNNNPHFLYKIIDVVTVLICWFSALPISYNYPLIIIYKILQTSENLKRGSLLSNLDLSPYPKLHKKLDLNLPFEKNSLSTPLLLTPDIGPTSNPNALAAIIK